MVSEASELLAVADHIRPNDLEPTLKERWLREVEGMVHAEIRGTCPEQLFSDGALALTVPVPYDRLYVWYLCAMIDIAQGDMALYETDLAVYNAAFHDYAKWVLRNGGRSVPAPSELT